MLTDSEQPNPDACSTCPHCDEPLPPEPENWSWMPPWMCSMCGGLYGYGEAGPFRVELSLKPFNPLFCWIEALRFSYYSGSRTYVYALCYPSGMPFYIGKGKGGRVCQHYKNTFSEKYSRKGEKERLIFDLNERGESEWYYFLALCDTPEEALRVEQHWIWKLGVRSQGGMLCNLAPGCNQGQEYEQPLDAVVIPNWKGDEITHNSRDKPRIVHYPLEMRRNPKCALQKCWCPICNGECLIPEELRFISVQCPFCAHFFRPLAEARMRGAPTFSQHWQLFTR
jgi:hypothetical protein